jgi:hypothetical protein
MWQCIVMNLTNYSKICFDYKLLCGLIHMLMWCDISCVFVKSKAWLTIVTTKNYWTPYVTTCGMLQNVKLECGMSTFHSILWNQVSNICIQLTTLLKKIVILNFMNSPSLLNLPYLLGLHSQKYPFHGQGNYKSKHSQKIYYKTNAPITTHMCFNLLQLLGLSNSNELTLSQNGYHVYIEQWCSNDFLQLP